MYGEFVHKAVVRNKETETGITIHFVNPNYDEGEIIFQAKCSIAADDDPVDVANKVHDLEMKHFPLLIKKILDTRFPNGVLVVHLFDDKLRVTSHFEPAYTFMFRCLKTTKQPHVLGLIAGALVCCPWKVNARQAL